TDARPLGTRRGGARRPPTPRHRPRRPDLVPPGRPRGLRRGVERGAVGMTAATMTSTELRREYGIGLGRLRQLEASGALPVLEWVAPRSAILLRADVEAWIASRNERSRQRVQQRERRRAFVRGP